MFEIGNGLYKNFLPQSDRNSENIHARRYNQALNQFKSAVIKGQFTRLLKKVWHDRLWLVNLNSLKPSQGSYYSGLRVVEISHIIGSEGRTSDFDIDFLPVHESSRERWVGLAIAYLSNLPLPPVKLIEIDGLYFVRDGHHRISVARSFGQFAMDAEVITWNVQHSYQPEDALMKTGERSRELFIRRLNHG